MTDILCNWLNNEVKLSVRVDPTNFAKEFSTGYLLGEVLNKYQLQDDFDKFSQAKTADSKLNNFTRVEPVLHLLEVPFDTNVARDVMTERHGVATRLMYQLFIALSKKQKNNLTGVAMETMRPPAPVKLENVESLMYKERLKHLTPRQTDLNLEALIERYHKKQVQMEQIAFKERFEEEERYMQRIQEQREALREKHRLVRAKKSEMLAKIQAATVHIPKPPANKTAKAIAERKYEKLKIEAEMALAEIEAFEEKLKRTLPPSKPVGIETTQAVEQPDPVDLIKPSSNDDYINMIRKRLNEDAAARAEREKRRRKVLVDQIKAHEAQEDARREEMLVNRLMRQSQQERRIAVQLLQARHEKDVIRKNRMMREKQYEERRLKEFQEALNREAEIAHLAKLEYIDQTQKDRELHDKIMAERAQARYTKHYNICAEILSDIVDFSTKVGEYRELTNKLLPAKLMRDWTTLFVEGKPLYEVSASGEENAEPTPEEILEEERQCLLDEADFNEYRNMIGEWQPPEDSDITGPPPDNPIIGHIVQRLLDIVHPPTSPPPAPQFPPFPIKACVMGKVFSGKTTVCKKLAERHCLQILDVEALVSEAIEAHKNGEVIKEVPEEEKEAAEQIPAAEPSAGNTPASDKQATPQTGPEGIYEAPNKQEDGMEKMDPEKPVASEIDQEVGESLLKSASTLSTGKVSRKGSHRPSNSSVSSSPPKATPRAKLGWKALNYLKKGRTVEDGLLVDVVIEAIKRIPEGTGWILDGFPATYAQAKLLEKALTGMEAGSRESSKLNMRESKSKPRKSVLAPDPQPAPPPPEPISGLDVVIMIDIPDELALKRAAGRSYAVQADEEYHQEFKPPPEGAATGVNKQEKVIPVEDPAHDQDQIQHRLITFQDTWPKMEKWFSKFGILHKVDASQELESVFSEVQGILEETLKKLQGLTAEETSTEVADGSKQDEKPADSVKIPEPIQEKTEQREEGESRPSSKKGSRAGSPKRANSRGSSAEKKAKKSSSRASSKEGKKSSGKGSRGSSPKSPKRGKSGGRKAKTPEPETEPEPLGTPPGTPAPQPGSDLWVFVDDPIDEELAHILSSHWETVENTYIGNSKTVFRSIRQERERIIRYLYQIKQDFLTYLRRPDHKQEFVLQWQKEFNEIPDHLRDDEEVRCELHQRVDDLRERLWSICDERKEQAEKERETIMSDGWVDDRVGILTNYYVTLIQGEVDRFQDTVHMLKDYYRAMEGKVPDEPPSDFIRLPLVELPFEEVIPPEEEREDEPGEEDNQQEDVNEEGKPSSGKTGSPFAKNKQDEKGEDEVEEKKSRIPLVPRRPASPDSAAAGAKKPDKAKSKAGKESEDGPPPPADPDEKLLFDAFMAGVQAMEKLVASEQAAKEAEEEAEKVKEQEREAEKMKAAADTKKKGGKAGGGGGKGGKKSRSPSPKKGRGGKDSSAQATPLPDEGEESEEEKNKKLTRERAKQEFFAALQFEISAAKCRIDLVRHVAAKIIAGLKDKAESAYNDMNDWLGARFLKEMESIDQMSEVMRFAIENGTKIHQELKIDQEDFFIDQDVKVLKSPSPQPRPDPVEKVNPDTFAVEQIKNLYHQFSLIAPSGMMSVKTLQEILIDMTSLSHGTEQLPEAWLNLSSEKLEAIAVSLSADGEYVDWHGCLLQLAQPWPVPTQTELLETLERFKQMDQSNSGYVTREQYEMVDLWFNKQSKPPTPEDPTEPVPYDRLANLKKAFFDIFADHSTEPVKLDYVKMLLYFSIAPDPYDGFLRALSVASGTHIPRLTNKKIIIKKSSRPMSEASLGLYEGEGLGSAELDNKLQEDIPETAVNALVPLDALDKVLHHSLNMRGDSHRFSVSADPEDAFSRERLAGIYQELGSENLEPLAYSKLIEHPVLQDIVSMCNTYRALDLKAMLTQPAQDNLDIQSLRTGD